MRVAASSAWAADAWSDASVLGAATSETTENIVLGEYLDIPRRSDAVLEALRPCAERPADEDGSDGVVAGPDPHASRDARSLPPAGSPRHGSGRHPRPGVELLNDDGPPPSGAAKSGLPSPVPWRTGGGVNQDGALSAAGSGAAAGAGRGPGAAFRTGGG